MPIVTITVHTRLKNILKILLYFSTGPFNLHCYIECVCSQELNFDLTFLSPTCFSQLCMNPMKCHCPSQILSSFTLLLPASLWILDVHFNANLLACHIIVNILASCIVQTQKPLCAFRTKLDLEFPWWLYMYQCSLFSNSGKYQYNVVDNYKPSVDRSKLRNCLILVFL